jgi:phosphatidylglycerophosphate synthase
MKSRFFWLPNALSLSRGILAIPMAICALNGAWVAGFWLLIIALVTDFFDGLAAKKLHAESKLGGHFDRVSDFTLACLGTFALVVGADILSLHILWFAIPASAFVGYVKFFRQEGTPLYRVTSVFSILLLFGTWIFVIWGFASEAYGWYWWYPPATFLILTSAALLKRHRLRSWFGWLAQRPRR